MLCSPGKWEAASELGTDGSSGFLRNESGVSTCLKAEGSLHPWGQGGRQAGAGTRGRHSGRAEAKGKTPTEKGEGTRGERRAAGRDGAGAGRDALARATPESPCWWTGGGASKVMEGRKRAAFRLPAASAHQVSTGPMGTQPADPLRMLSPSPSWDPDSGGGQSWLTAC